MLGSCAVEELGNQGPFGAVLGDRGNELKVLYVSPFAAIDFRCKVIEPLLSALMRGSEELLL